MRKLVVEAGWVQKRKYDLGWLDVKKVVAVTRKAWRNTGCTIARHGGVRHQIPEGLETWAQRAKTLKDDWKWQRGITSCPLSGSNWRKSHVSVRRWESEKAQELGHAGRRPPGPCSHGRLLGVSGRWIACVWSVVQLVHDEEMGPLHGMYGTLDAPSRGKS